MKKITLLLLLTLCLSISIVPTLHAQETEAAALVLDLEKLNQLRQILQKMYDGYKILVEGYNKVRDITSGNYKIHEIFLDGLLLVSPTVRKYERIAEIIEDELKILSESKSAFNRIKDAKAFSPQQLEYISGVYDRLLSASLQGLDELTIVITSGKLRMSDDERLSAIDRVYVNMKQNLSFVRAFNQENAISAGQRLKEKQEIGTLDNLFNK
ncbi:TerB family tellurite resistance protein [Chitinophaga sp. CC14]|uniref:TerB family tellurite resistance protein n=1 Tax=Chitinophaga sp. CC14 TaxID=3029199 RepID=UPI003B7675A8